MTTKKRIPLKSIEDQPANGKTAIFSYDPFSPDCVSVDFQPNVWKMDRETLLAGGDIGGDVAIFVNDDVTTIVFSAPSGTATVEFRTALIRNFVSLATTDVNIPAMREAAVDNFIVECLSTAW